MMNYKETKWRRIICNIKLIKCNTDLSSAIAIYRTTSFNADITIFMLLCGALILPIIPIGGLNIRISDIIALGILPIFLLFFQKTHKSYNLYFLIIIFGSFIWSTLYGYLFLAVPFTLRDVNELLRMLIILLTYWISINVKLNTIKQAINLFFLVGTPFIICFSCIQYFAPHSIPGFILNLYGGELHVSTLLSHSNPRIFATGSDPNTGAAIILLFLFYHLSRYIEGRHIMSAILMVMFFLLLGLAASRTGLVASFFSLYVFLLFSKNIKLTMKTSIILLLPIFGYLVWQSVDYIRIGFLTFLTGENNSWETRMQLFEDAKNLFFQSPVFGWGPAKAIHTTIVDGEYFLLIRRYGIIGLSCVMIFIIQSVWLSFRIVNNSSKKVVSSQIFAMTSILYSLAMFIIMITNKFFSSYQLVIPYLVLLACIERGENSKKQYKLFSNL